MGKYSSDSDYEKRSGKRSESHKSSRRRRSDSSDSSESRSRRANRDKRSKRTRRSRSRDKYSRSKRSESSSRSSSRLNNSKYRSSRRSRSKSRSRDRDRRSRLRRSRSRSYIREYTSRPRRRTSSSSDSSSSKDSRDKNRKDNRGPKKDSAKLSGNGKVDQSAAKPEQQETVAPTVQEEMPQFDAVALDEINSEGFAPKSFNSDKKPMENIVINLKNQTIKVPEAENKQSEEATSLYHHNLFASEEARMQKWVKELYIYRQKALQQGVRN